ncbi:hypothetical protein ES332_A09G083500v1 [Gossypium tomentosum]|uniref:Uncharacterized protein n=1 Tax=Gossypium tomentosum TaxID=34277 RepID=A0A5D2P1D7_GOSTO|nr:hypothetical protein ES332_A09G083500v1 [Gossypium tomentosum]
MWKSNFPIYYQENYFPLFVRNNSKDLLYKDYQTDQKFTLTTSSPTGVAITSARTKKGDIFLADVNTQLNFRNVTIVIKVDTSSNLFTTITVDEPAPVLNAIFGFKVPDQRSDKGDAVNTSYYHIVNSSTNTAVGAKVTHSFSTNVNIITVGTQHALDPLTTIKARVNNWHSKSLFTISGEVDTESNDKSPKVGLALALKP